MDSHACLSSTSHEDGRNAVMTMCGVEEGRKDSVGDYADAKAFAATWFAAYGNGG